MAPTGTAVAFRYGIAKKGKGVGGDGRRALCQPRGLHVCSDGSLLVADFGNHCVVRFKPGDARGEVVAGEEGKILPTVDPLKDIDRPLGAPEGEGLLLKQPSDACEHREGGFLVLDSDACRVQRFGERGVPAPTVVPSAAQRSVHVAEAIKMPRAMLQCPDGALVVCDTWSHRVLRFAVPDGSGVAEEKPTVLAGAPNSCGTRPDQLAFPSGVALDRDGALLVADTNNHRVQRFLPGDEHGKTVAGSPKGECGSGLGELNMPTALCVDPHDGSVLVADRANARVLRFPANSHAGDPGVVIAGPDLVERPWGVCLGADGSVYVSDERRATVLRLEVCEGQPPPPGGGAAPVAPRAKFAPPARVAPVSAALAKDGNMELD